MILFGIIFVNLIIFDTAKCQRSCSDIANFYSNNNGIYGQVEFFQVPIQQENLFKIELSVAARLPNGNGGSVDMLNQDAYNDILNGRKIILKFIPEIANPLPVVSGVFLNGNRICSSPPATGRTVSTITLSFTYTISGLPQITSTNFQPNYNPPFYYPNQETTKIIYKQPTFRTKAPIKQAKPIILTTLSHAPSKQTTQFQINNKLGNINNGQSYVCGVRRDSSSAVSFVIGGITARRNDFPWLTAFYYRENGFICGGTLVSTKIIVTAAHCVKDKLDIEEKNPEDSTFYLGKYKINDLNEKDYVTAGVKEFKIHPSWNSLEESYTGDIAIAVIYRTIKFTNNIIPLCLPPQKNNHKDIVHKTGLIAGWGITEKKKISDAPMFVSLPVVDDEECLRSSGVFAKITSTTTFCVGDGSGRSPCNGDSGGAFAMKNDDGKYYFRGIVSAGIRGDSYSCDNTKYAIFTDVAQYTDWIKNHISMNE